MKSSLFLFLIRILVQRLSFVLFVVFTLTQCAKRIDVKKRMAQGLAKRDLQMMEFPDELQALVKKYVSNSQSAKTIRNIKGS